MNNSREVGLTIYNNIGFLKKIFNFFKNKFIKTESNKFSSNENDNMKKNTDFIKSIKIEPDKEKELLLKIQDEIEEKGINKSTVLLLTQELSEEQKKRLKQLYKEQINDIKLSTQNYKQNIIKIKKKLAVN